MRDQCCEILRCENTGCQGCIVLQAYRDDPNWLEGYKQHKIAKAIENGDLPNMCGKCEINDICLFNSQNEMRIDKYTIEECQDRLETKVSRKELKNILQHIADAKQGNANPFSITELEQAEREINQLLKTA